MSKIPSSLTPEQKERAELQAQVKYLQVQLDQLMKEDEGRGPFWPRRERNLDSKVHIPKFEGQLDPDLFLEWLWTVESVFAYEDIPEANKVKLVALRLRKYASNWWANLVAKRVRQGKDKIRTWAKMKSKLKGRFLPPNYLHSSYSQLPHLTQALTPFDEVREFVKPPPKGQPFNKGNPSYPSKPLTPSNFFPQEDQAPQNSPLLQHNEQTFFKEEKEDRAICLMEESQEEKSCELYLEKDQEEIVEEVVDDDQSACEAFILLDSPQKFEFEQVGPSLPPNGACNDNQAADWNLPPTFDEQELQVFKSEPYGVVEEFEPPLPQKESLHSQQELRTILFEERENDVYFQGVHFHSPNSTSWEASSMQTHTCQYSFWTLLFEFHDKRHVMEFYLAKKELRQSNGAIGTSSRTWPVFVPLVS